MELLMEMIKAAYDVPFGWIMVFMVMTMFISAVIAVALAIRKHLVATRNELDINPCPRCGGEAMVEKMGETLSGEYWVVVRCNECGYSDGWFYNDIETAIKEWNK